MKKRIISMILCSAAAVGLLSGCGSSKETTEAPAADVKTEAQEEQSTESAEAGEKITLRMSYWNSEDTVAALLDYLKEAVPHVEIEYQFVDNSNYDTIIDTQLSAEEGPDIICESPGSALRHARLGYLAPLNDLAANYSAAGTSVYSL